MSVGRAGQGMAWLSQAKHWAVSIWASACEAGPREAGARVVARGPVGRDTGSCRFTGLSQSNDSLFAGRWSPQSAASSNAGNRNVLRNCLL